MTYFHHSDNHDPDPPSGLFFLVTCPSLIAELKGGENVAELVAKLRQKYPQDVTGRIISSYLFDDGEESR